MPDTTTESYQRLTLGLAKIGRNHPYVGLTDPDRIRTELIDRSLAARPLLDPDRPILDVGSGVGIPGLPLALPSDAPPVTCLEPRTECISLIRWLCDRLDDRTVKLIPATLQDADLSREESHQVVSRAALDWCTFRDALPDPHAPILRWTGPDVDPPPDRPRWRHRTFEAHPSRLSSPQQLTWWGPEELFHVKQLDDPPCPWLRPLE